MKVETSVSVELSEQAVRLGAAAAVLIVVAVCVTVAVVGPALLCST